MGLNFLIAGYGYTNGNVSFSPSVPIENAQLAIHSAGWGGVHGAADSGIYESTEDMIIMSSDVTSFYPNLAIRNKWSPAHIPKEEFCEQYEWFFEERKKLPKKDPKNYVYKIILNSPFGLSIDENSFLYDPQFGMQTPLTGS